MKYLTIDTTTKVTAVALAEDGWLVAEGFLHTSKMHSERLIPMLDQLLTAAAWTLQDLDMIGVVRGPGSFTGIRIGIATAQGLAQVLNLPLIAVLSLDALAWAGMGRTEDIVPILDARKNEWYTARYHWTRGEGKAECLTPPQALSTDHWLVQLRDLDRTICFVGDAAAKAKNRIEDVLGERAVILPEYESLPRGAYAARAIWQRWQEVGVGERVEPYYIRFSEAEVNWAKKRKHEGERSVNNGIVRTMLIDDLEAILEIERGSFSNPWSLEAFKAELLENEYARYLCLELDGQVIGYMGLWFILDEGHITNIAIAPNYRGQHWGDFLMRFVMEKMFKQGMERMTLEVRVSNTAAQSLYKRLGFASAGVRKGYYADTQEDALIMWAELGVNSFS